MRRIKTATAEIISIVVVDSMEFALHCFVLPLNNSMPAASISISPLHQDKNTKITHDLEKNSRPFGERKIRDKKERLLVTAVKGAAQGS